MKRFLKNNWPFFILLTLAFLTRFLFLSYPPEVVFDEVHFGKFVSAYFTHQYYFDIHPPLGKLMIAGFAKLFGFQGNFDFSKIGEIFDAKNLFILRFLPAFFGALFVVLIYKFVLAAAISKKAAFLAGFLVLFDNAFLVESKFILVDIFLLFFGFLALYFFILSKNYSASVKKSLLFLTLAAISAGLTLSIKWTGLSFLGIILFFICLDFLKNFKFKEFLVKSVILIFIPFLVYLSFFALHFNLLSKSGPGDAFMSQEFQKTLLGNNVTNPAIEPFSFWQKFTELNQKMYFYSSTLKTGHQDASKWFEWPLMKKPVWYWTHSEISPHQSFANAQDGTGQAGQTTDKVANIYLLGNPLIWWLVAVIIPITLFILFFKKIRRNFPPIIYLLLIGYFANLLPFIFISRVAFLYHYLPSLIFGILIFVLLTEKFLKNNFLYFSLLFLIFGIFLFLLPLSYGFFISSELNQFYTKFISILH